MECRRSRLERSLLIRRANPLRSPKAISGHEPRAHQRANIREEYHKTEAIYRRYAIVSKSDLAEGVSSADPQESQAGLRNATI
jgi:hypothetical protein